MNLQIELRKIIDAINSQPPVIRLILWFFVLVFVIIPLSLPAAIVYLIWTALRYRERVK